MASSLPHARVEEFMTNSSRVTTWASAAIVFVILPLLVTIATLGANLAAESTGGYSGLGDLGMAHAVLFAWSVVAVAVVGGLIATMFKELHHS
jgi:hypothetical protein